MEIKSAEFVISNTDVSKCPATTLPEYAFIGRSNVGKSSLINMLANHKKLKLKKIISSYVLRREQLTNLFVLVDSRHEPQKIDLEFIEWLGVNGVPFSIVFTKADKQGSKKLNSNVAHYLDVLKEQWEELPPYFVTSSSEKTGRTELLDYIEKINQSL